MTQNVTIDITLGNKIISKLAVFLGNEQCDQIGLLLQDLGYIFLLKCPKHLVTSLYVLKNVTFVYRISSWSHWTNEDQRPYCEEFPV